MTSAAQNDGGSSAPSATAESSRQEQNRGLVRESFDRILDILQQLGLHRKSPKLFMIYAHENENANLKAHQETVRDYITWFKKILFNVDSDKSPHGYSLLHDSVHAGASVDILKNQICLLPTSWHSENVDYVLVFYSRLLAKYMKTSAISSAVMRPTPKLYPTLSRSPNIGYTIPIILSGDEKDWECQFKWEPHFVNTQKTQIQITIESEKEYQGFFKILLMFESLEIHRRPIEAMRKCFDDCVELLKGDVQPEKYREQVEIHIYEAMRNLNQQWKMIERPITPGHIRDRLNIYSKLDVQSIRRVSGEKLPESLIDIDLAVTERLNSRDELPVDGQQEGKQMPLRGLFDERNVGKRQIVPLHGLFDERNVGGENIRPQRILIQGRPGIGKTTLCRRLMYEYSWHENLRKKFDLVVRIPVRKLENSADLNNLLFEEYFQDVSEGRDLSNKLGDLILDHENANLENTNASSVRILIILDGLDEARRWSQERRALLEKLIGRPAVVITSRSHETNMLHLSIDLHLEALGLDKMSVNAYLNNTRIVASDTAREIRLVIEANSFVKDMVRVPIHLDILCYSWGEIHRQNAPIESTTDEGEHVSPTITALYQAVVRSLWRKDIPNLDKLDQGELMTVEIINAVRDSARLERLVDTESNFLEEVANTMMEEDRQEFTDNDIAEAIRNLESKGKQLPLSLERNLHKLSLLRSYPTEGHQKYRFVHLTFQEFFAARYLARQVARDRAPFEAILRQQKYNRQYEIIWMFFTGLLSKSEELDSFFNLLDEEPRDLVGIQHIQLFMYCLSECQIRIRPNRWTEYQGRLENWLLLDFRVGKYHGIGSSMAFPENILRKKLLLGAESKLTASMVRTLVQTIQARDSLSESFIQYVSQLIANDHDNYLFDSIMLMYRAPVAPEFRDTVKRNFTTIWIPKAKGKLPETDISFFLKQIQSQTRQTTDACYILSRQLHLPNVAIKELVGWLKDSRLSRVADSILAKQATLSKETIDSVIENFFDQRSLGSSAYWYNLFRSSVLHRQDLHAEAIAKIWDHLENEAMRNERIPDEFLLKVSRNNPIRPDDVVRLVKLLEIRLCHECTGLKNFAIKVLKQQPSLPTNVLERIVELLCDEHIEVSRAAQQILQNRPDLHRDIIDKLRELFENDKHKAVAVLKERLHLPADAMERLVTKIPERKDNPIEYDKMVNYLLSQCDPPDYLVNSLREFIGKGVDFELVAELVGQQRKPSDEVVNRLLEFIPLETIIWPKVIHQNAFTDPLIKALEQATGRIEARNVGRMLKPTKLDQESVKRLRTLLNTNATTGLEDLKSKIASNCLKKQVKLDRETILDLHNYILKRESLPMLGVESLWKHRRIEQFCANLTLFDSLSIEVILYIFLKRSVKDLTPAYIDGETLYFNSADGKLAEQRLEDEQAFREKFREAQRMLEVPEWAWIKLPKGRGTRIRALLQGLVMRIGTQSSVKSLARNEAGTGWSG